MNVIIQEEQYRVDIEVPDDFTVIVDTLADDVIVVGAFSGEFSMEFL